MKTRIISGLIMVPLILLLVFRGIPLAIFAFIISAIAVYELFKGFSNIGITGNIFIAWGALIALYLIHFLMPERHDYLTCWLVISIIASFLGIFKAEKHKAEDALVTILGIVYVEFFIYHIILIDEGSYGILVWMVAGTAILTDIFAYFTGYFFGKHKLAPVLSPKKTIEGALGGVLGSVLFSIVFALIAKLDIFPHMVLMGVVGSIFAQLGDLTASAFKRKIGIKDYGNIIPGHGGILDRVDSIIFTAPVIYYYLQLVFLH